MHLLLVRRQLPLDFLCIIFQLFKRVSKHLSQVVRFVQCVIHCLSHAGRLNWNEIERFGDRHEAFGDENCRRIKIVDAIKEYCQLIQCPTLELSTMTNLYGKLLKLPQLKK